MGSRALSTLAVALALAPASSGCERAAPAPGVAPTALSPYSPPAAPPGTSAPPTDASSPTPAPASASAAMALRVVDVAIGANRACVLVQGGRVACFSTTATGRRIDLEHAGRPWTAPSDPPLLAMLVPGLPPALATAVAVGQDHACVVRDDGGVGCWGSDARGQLGTSSASEGPPPQPVTGLARIAAIDAAWATTYAVGRDGDAWGWGAGDAGVLGPPSSADERAPVRLRALPPVLQIAGGGRHACALARDGDVWCWGSNELGELGVAASSGPRTPARVAGVHHAIAVGAGTERSCALLADGHVVCWGELGYAASGGRSKTYARPPDMPPFTDGPDPDPFTVTWNEAPTAVPGVDGAAQLASGADVDCVRDARGAQCWSAGGHGLGRGALPPTRLPVPSVTRVAAGQHFACAVDGAGTATCFTIEEGRLGPGQIVRFEP